LHSVVVHGVKLEVALSPAMGSLFRGVLDLGLALAAEVLLLREADLVDSMLPEPGDKLAVLPEIHLTAAVGEHTIQVHLQLQLRIVDAIFIVV